MIDSKRLLDQFLGAGASTGGTAGGSGGASAGGGLGDLLGNAFGGGGTGGSGGGLGDILSGALGGLTGGGKDGAAGGGIGGMAGQVTDFAKNNPGLSTVIAGGLASVLLGGKGPKLKADALTLGGLAAIGTLAYKAYQQYKVNNPGAPAPLPPAAPTAAAPTTTGDDGLARSILVAMIAAAKADGHIDDQEKQKILGKISEGGLTAEEQDFLATELAAPLDFNKVVDSATGPEHAIQLYAASLLAVSADTPAERGYLDMLAARLGIDGPLKATIEQTVASAAA